METRDYFAANCPESFIPDIVWRDVKRTLGLNFRLEFIDWKLEHTLKYICIKRYEYADMMLKVANETISKN